MNKPIDYCKCKYSSPSSHHDHCINDGCHKLIKTIYVEYDELRQENAKMRAALTSLKDTGIEYGEFWVVEVVDSIIEEIDSSKVNKCPSCTVPCGNEWCCYSNPTKSGK